MGFVGFGQRLCAGSGGLALSLPKASAKQRPCAAVSGLALSVIASRCHLSQSERPWQSVKFPVYTLYALLPQGSRRRYAKTFRLCQGLPLWGSWREAPERARTLTRSCALGLALPCGSTAPSEARSKPRLCAASAGLALSVIASRCHLSQSERPWQSAKFPVYTLRPAAARGAVRRCAQTSRLCQGLPLWERLPPAGGRCRICDRGRTAGAKRLRGRARQREPCAFVSHCVP